MGQGELYDLADQYKQRLLRMERAAASEMVRYYAEVHREIQHRVADLLAEYEAAPEQVRPGWLYQFERLKALQAQVEAEMGRFAVFAEGRISGNQKEAVRLAREQAEALTWAALGKPPDGVSVVWNRLPSEATESLVGFLQDGSPLKDLLNELLGEAGKLVAQGLTRGLALGQNPRVIAKEIQSLLGGNLTRALRISRTEVLRSYRESTRRCYLGNQDLVRGWVWLSAANERTCAVCWGLHGTEHSLEERQVDHVCGHCTSVPITQSWAEIGKEFGLDLSGIEDLGQVESGESLFATQSRESQIKVLGPAKFAAYKEGQIKLGDLIGYKDSPKWGRSPYEKSLTEVLGKERAKEYTRLALMGVARRAGEYSVNDLIRVAGIGLRKLEPNEIARIRDEVIKNGFFDQLVKVKTKDQGKSYLGKVLGAKENSLFYHLFTRVVNDEQWVNGTTENRYLQDIFASIQQKQTKISVYHRYGGWCVGFFTPNELDASKLGAKYQPWIYSIYSIQRRAIISSYQVSGLETISIPEGAVWIR